MEFKDMLKYFRMREGLSQKDLALKLGIAPSTISMYEVGKREPDFDTEEKIADFFNVNLNTLRGKDAETAATPSLPPDQASILAKYGKLNTAGKEKLQERADELIVMGYTEEEECRKKEEA